MSNRFIIASIYMKVNLTCIHFPIITHFLLLSLIFIYQQLFFGNGLVQDVFLINKIMWHSIECAISAVMIDRIKQDEGKSNFVKTIIQRVIIKDKRVELYDNDNKINLYEMRETKQNFKDDKAKIPKYKELEKQYDVRRKRIIRESQKQQPQDDLLDIIDFEKMKNRKDDNIFQNIKKYKNKKRSIQNNKERILLFLTKLKQ
ncbi:hypothetical protein pb186bvf_016455 [Paramecium bursaria]